MIRVHMGVNDLQHTRFVHSPLMEMVESLWIMSSRRVQAVHQGWYDQVKDRLRKIDRELLDVVVPGSKMALAKFLLPTATDAPTTIEAQLQQLATMSSQQLRHDLTELWQHQPPPAAHRLLADHRAGPRRVADALWQYWTIAIAPHWPGIRAVIDKDISFRAAALARYGVPAMFAGLHRRVNLDGDTLNLNISATTVRRLTGAGLRLVPSVFAWPYLIFDTDAAIPSSLTYPARGVGELWASPPDRDNDALHDLLGHNRADILTTLAAPYPTLTLAHQLKLSPPTVNRHLSVLRRAGLVTSWRSGRYVYYQRTTLGTSIIEASTVLSR